MDLRLVKIQDGLSKGAVLYHAYNQKTEAEMTQLLMEKKEKELVFLITYLVLE